MTQRTPKYIFITGGVVSSLGKGLAAASIGCLLEGHGYKVTMQKFDPYINVDPGTMSPYQHGEVFVTDDGGETEPTQHSVRDLRSIGIQPDILLCRTDRFLDPDLKRKIALFCDVDEEAVITAKDVSTIYEVPVVLAAEGLDKIVLKYLHLPQTERRMQAWEDLVSRIKHPVDEITIHVVGKYVGYEDSYKSLNEAIYHGGFPHSLKDNIKWIEAESLEAPDRQALLEDDDGII